MVRPATKALVLPEDYEIRRRSAVPLRTPAAWKDSRHAAVGPASGGKIARQQSASHGDARPLTSAAVLDPLPAPMRQAAGAAKRLLLQSGALAYRFTAGGKVRVLLVSKRRSKRWGIPKGKAEPHLSLAENAAKEAFEEAGVKGRVASLPAGRFRTTKQSQLRLSKAAIEVWVYLLEVTELSADWPEKGKRRIKWVSSRKAAEMLEEPLLAALCHQLAVARPS